jgi:hypothetical protein
MATRIGQVWEAYCSATWAGWEKVYVPGDDSLPVWINLSRYNGDLPDWRSIIDPTVMAPPIRLQIGDKFLISGRNRKIQRKVWRCTTAECEFQITHNDLVSIARRVSD